MSQDNFWAVSKKPSSSPVKPLLFYLYLFVTYFKTKLQGNRCKGRRLPHFSSSNQRFSRSLICVMRDSKHYGVTSFGISSEGEGTVPCPVVRKFISPAVYVESSAKRMALKLSDSSSQHFFKVKKCVCSTEAEICVCHPEKPPQKATAVKVSPLSSKSSIKTDSGYSGSAGANLDREDLRLSLTSLTANSSINNCDEDIRRKVYQDWLVKKKKEELLRQLQEEKIQKEKELERLKKLEQERESFRKWLLSKKKEEEKKKLVKWRKEEEEKILTARSKVDPEENEMRFRAWLKRKEKEKLGVYFL